LTSTYSPSPLTGEGLPCGVCFTTPRGEGEGVIVPFVSPSPLSPPARGGERRGEFLGFVFLNVYFGEPLMFEIRALDRSGQMKYSTVILKKE